jgi:hypothetical protein
MDLNSVNITATQVAKNYFSAYVENGFIYSYSVYGERQQVGVTNDAYTALQKTAANDIDIVVPSRTIYNGQCEKLLIQQAIPVSTNGNAVPVKLTIGDASVLLLDRCGNAVFSDQLKSRKIYDIRFHTTALTATILCSIPNCTSGVNTVFNPATPPSEPVPSN